ncbi:MAG: hypothetical protein Q7S68_04165 [Deltaproteobacteria bacterium]|nr:hypothetical protein [Deltaproteobacteria bacterium]
MVLSSLEVVTARGELLRIEQWVDYVVKQAEEDSSGFFGALQNLTPQNLWGFYPAIFGDGKPFSSQELEGSKRLLSDLRRMRAGAEILIGQFSQGSLVVESPLVQEFLEGPFGELLRSEPSNNDAPASVHYYRRLIGQASRYGATRLARTISNDANRKLNTLREGLGDYYKERLEETLPSRTWQFFIDTANTIFSLDSLFLFGTGGLAGRVLGTTLSGVVAMEKSLERIKKFAWLMPGQFFIQEGTQSLFGQLLKLSVNLPVEWWKLYGCVQAGNFLGGSEGAKVATHLTMFLGGMHMAYGSSVCESYLSGLRRKEPTAIAQYLLEKNSMTKAETLNLLRGTHGWLTHRSGRLTRTGNYVKTERSVERGYDRAVQFLESKKDLQGSIANRWREIEVFGTGEAGIVEKTILDRARALHREAVVPYPQRSLEKILADLEELKEPFLRRERLIGRVDECLDEITKMANRFQGVVEGDALARAKALAVQARRSKQVELDGIFDQLAQIRSAASRDVHRRLQRARHFSPVPETRGKGKGGGGGRRDTHRRRVVEEAPPARQVAAQPAISPFQSVINNPPPQFELDTFRQLASGRVSLAKRAKREIEEFYARSENAGHRSAIWNALSDLNNGNLRANAQMSWKRVQVQESPTVRTWIGSDHRLMAIQLEDKSYRVVSLRLKNKRTYKS